jgi:hypothetical protein
MRRTTLWWLLWPCAKLLGLRIPARSVRELEDHPQWPLPDMPLFL